MRVRIGTSLLFCLGLAIVFAPGGWAQSSDRISATTIPQDRLIQPEELNRELQDHPHAALVLQVGSRMLFDEAHIPGAEYAGPASRPEGLEALRTRVTDLPRDRALVIYCGCCPWDHCPNMGPAWALLHRMGFTNVRALYLADNFGADWVAKGYRAEKSQ
ncbi:MAG TPA: rhodanese-like domain-containing protein [Acidobacteriaceae bacterium]|nr:rhodanese-like domain-containing protein [Acidobacteriaceae bacterium]